VDVEAGLTERQRGAEAADASADDGDAKHGMIVPRQRAKEPGGSRIGTIFRCLAEAVEVVCRFDRDWNDRIGRMIWPKPPPDKFLSRMSNDRAIDYGEIVHTR
jgi:hypothetical protein